MFAVLNCMPYVLAWPLNEQCDGCCLENIERSGLGIIYLIHSVPYFVSSTHHIVHSKENWREESIWFVRSRISSRHKAILRDALIMYDPSRFFLLLQVFPLLWTHLPMNGGMGAAFPFWLRNEEAALPKLLLQLPGTQRAILACCYSKGVPVQEMKLCPVLCMEP